MNQTSFMFWDSETTGLDKAFDVPLEIGALVTERLARCWQQRAP
jgi:oligoribonuclease (3'-5' exoribonuclease)